MENKMPRIRPGRAVTAVERKGLLNLGHHESLAPSRRPDMPTSMPRPAPARRAIRHQLFSDRRVGQLSVCYGPGDLALVDIRARNRIRARWVAAASYVS